MIKGILSGGAALLAAVLAAGTASAGQEGHGGDPLAAVIVATRKGARKLVARPASA